MTGPAKEPNFEDDVSAGIIEQAYATDSMKKFSGSGMSGRRTNSSRRGKKKKPTAAENDDEGHDSDEAVRDDNGQQDDDILEEVYATDSLKKLQKKPTSTTSSGQRGGTRRQKRADGLNAISEDKSAKDLVEGLRSFRLDKERLRDEQARVSRKKKFAHKVP